MRTALGALSGLLLASTTYAADIKNLGVIGGINTVMISGEIVSGDADHFQQIVTPLRGPTVIWLSSPGGSLGDGLDIGQMIHDRKFATAVADQICASVCGDIWLAGSPRLKSVKSRIGFHAAYNQDGAETGLGNALVGAYLAKLDLPLEAIAYATAAHPQQMQWLNAEDAGRVGITYSLLHDTEPSQPQQSSAEQQAIQLVLNYHAYWSQGGTNVEGLAQYYAPMVTFYGGPMTRERVMAEKRKFSARWPVRHYTVDQQRIFAQCDSSGCAVSGVVAWDCNSIERSAHSVGTANFVLKIANGVIVSENGATLSRSVEDIPSMPQTGQSMSNPAYDQGRHARIDYEQWYAGLVDGDFKNGATFWAIHRSDKTQPGCAGGSPDWQAGCVAAQARLRWIDVRRTTEKDFWNGWNSL